MLGYNTLVVLAGCALLGLACGTVGAFALLRGRALMADAVGHAALPGVVLAAMLVASLGGNPRALPPLLAGAVIAGVLGVLSVQALTRGGRIREDAAIAIGDQVQTGTWFMNRCDYLDPALAWTGVKNSGRGCTLSTVGFESLTRPKSYHLKTV